MQVRKPVKQEHIFKNLFPLCSQSPLNQQLLHQQQVIQQLQQTIHQLQKKELHIADYTAREDLLQKEIEDIDLQRCATLPYLAKILKRENLELRCESLERQLQASNQLAEALQEQAVLAQVF